MKMKGEKYSLLFGFRFNTVLVIHAIHINLFNYMLRFYSFTLIFFNIGYVILLSYLSVVCLNTVKK